MVAKKKSKGGWPKGKKRDLSEKELEQRRSAAIKHSRHVKDPLRQAAGPCKESHCPREQDGAPETSFPCSARQAADEAKAGLSCCVVNLATRENAQEAIRKALVNGDLAAFESEVVMPGMAQMAAMHRREGERILRQGSLAAEQPLFDRDGNHLGDVPIKDPGVEAFFKLSGMLGMTAEQQGMTRTSKAKAGRDQAVGNFFDFAGKMSDRERDLEEES